MKQNSEELKDFLKASAGDDPAAERANARVADLFGRAEAAVPALARERVLARVLAPRPRRAAFLKPAFAIGAAAVAAFMLARPAALPEPLYSRDWLSYDNFPYYADEARMHLDPVHPGLMTLEALIPSAEQGFAL